MEIVRVAEIINETQNIKTIKFNWSASPTPGQFVMVWLPGVDEVPMSISHLGEMKGITVENVGDATQAMHGLRAGDKIGIKGPLGRGFELSGKNILVVGGGSGIAPLAPAVELCISQGKGVTCAMGARSQKDMLFAERMSSLVQVELASDDGSVGHHGFITEVAGKLLGENGYDRILACGPEPMLVRMLEMAASAKVHIQCSLERYMKCGIGICGSCQLGRYRVCKDGPVFDGDTLRKIDDLGKRKRDASGKIIDIQ